MRTAPPTDPTIPAGPLVRVVTRTRGAVIEGPAECGPVADPAAVAEAVLRWAGGLYQSDPGRRRLIDETVLNGGTALMNDAQAQDLQHQDLQHQDLQHQDLQHQDVRAQCPNAGQGPTQGASAHAH